MTRADKSLRRQAQRDQALLEFKGRSGVDLEALDEGQRWLLFAALNLVAQLSAVPLLRRLLAYLLCHCGLGLKVQLIAGALTVSPRALSSLRKAEPAQLLHSLRRTSLGKKPKLRPEHVGPLVRFVLDHPQAPLHQVLQFTHKTLGVSIKRHALRRFILRYSLGELHKERVTARPFFAVTPPSAAPLC